MIYVDHNATTPMLPEVVRALDAAWQEGYAHPQSLHAAGRAARRRLDQAREHIAQALGAEPGHVVFLASGTQANQAAVLAATRREGARLVISPVEHPSVLDLAEDLVHAGVRVETVAVDQFGRVDLDHLETLLGERCDLVVIQGANHETGVCQDCEAIGRLCRFAGTPWLLDAVQLVGKDSFHFGKTGATMAVVSAHKFGGPRGIAALLLAPDTPPELAPPGFPDWETAGTQPVELAIGLETALGQLNPASRDRLRRLRDRLEQGLEDQFPGCVIHGRTVRRVAQTTSVAFPGMDRQVLLLALDQRGIACSAGSACRSGAAEPSPTLRAMGLPDRLVESTIRISLGHTTTDQDIDALLEALREVLPPQAI